MASPTPITLDLHEGDNIVIVERVLGLDQSILNDASIIVPAAGVGGIDLFVFDQDSVSSETPLFTELATAAGPGGMLAGLVTNDGYWTRDTIGYNFRRILAGNFMPVQGVKAYQLVVVLHTIAHGDIRIVRNIRVEPDFSA